MGIKTSLLSFILATVLMSSCTKTEIRYVEVSAPSTTMLTPTTSTIIPTTTVVSFSEDLRKAAASCLDSMPDMWLWDEPTYIDGLERNVEECRAFRLMGLIEKVDSATIDKLTTDLSEYLSTIEFIISWDDSCERAVMGGDSASIVDEINCSTGSVFANENLSEKYSRASRIISNLQTLLSQ